MCVSFLLGVDVGKNIDTYPGKIASLPQKVLSQIWRPSAAKNSTPVLENKTDQNQAKETEELDLTFYNTLTSKKGTGEGKPALDQKRSAESPQANKEANVPSKETDSTAITGKKESEKLQEKPQTAQEARTAQDVIAAKIQEAEEAAQQREKYLVQVASLKERNKAHQVSIKLSSLGYVPRIVENNVSGKGKWFRVVIDGFDSKTSAHNVAENISDKLGMVCVVRRVDAP